MGRVLTHSGFIAAILGILTFYLLHFSPDPYLFEAGRSRILNGPPNDNFTYYADLNSDGIQEQFIFANRDDMNSHVLVFNDVNSVLDQWNFLGSVNQKTIGYFIGNFDHDNCLEIAAFSVKGNSIYLNIIEPYGDTTFLVRNRLVDTIRNSNFNPALMIQDAQFQDLNHDRYDEFLFSLSSGFALQPRKVYSYDIRNDSLWKSPLSGTVFLKLMVFDFDKDGQKEVFGSTFGSNNYPVGQIARPDTSSWFMVLDEHLNLKCPPLPIGGLFSMSYPLRIQKGDECILYMVAMGEKNRKVYNNWYQVNPDMTLSIAKPPLTKLEFIPREIFESSSGEYHALHTSPDKIYFISDDLFSGIKLPVFIKNQVQMFNYPFGIPEIEYAFLIEGEQESILFLNKSGKKLGTIKLKSSDLYYRICWTGLADGLHQFLLSGQKAESWISVRPNPWQYWQYLILLAMVGGFFGFITFIRFIQSQQLARQEALRREVLELQMKAVRNQLDPHFTFNALNTLSGLSLIGDKQGVDHFISHFSQLLRTHLHTSDKILVPLKEEIEFVVNYVELQRIRFENAFHLELDISKEIDLGRLIPKMMIQTYVENAIKHGFSGMKTRKSDTQRGKLLVQVRENGKSMVIIIEDNGVGRGKSEVPNYESTGKGILSIEKIRESVRMLYGIRIRQEIVDLFDGNGNPAGTRVLLTIED